MVTIGSPHNGSTGVYYLEKLLTGSNVYKFFPGFIRALLFSILQGKFDPFGQQITQINGIPIDADARFHLIRTTIANGDIRRESVTVH